jgi:acyl transferase domain-containing protein/NADP-dependent 3-hydroxy acid dehydrogenase YdfG
MPEHARQVPVAVVGIAALMPGSPSVTEFWHTIVTGRDMITDVPATHWAVDDFYDPDPAAPDKTYARRGAFLPEIQFDPLAHGLPPATLAALDPGQLMGLVVADQLLADLDDGLAGPLERERVSVILGSSTLSRVGTMDARIQRPVWRKALRDEGIDEATAEAVCDRIAERYVPWQEASFPGLLSNVVAGRIANRLDLHGTNCTVDAACASSLAALTSAVNELSLGVADLVITGGVDATNNPLMYVCFSKTPALSPTGDARPFSDDADGTMLGEGVAMVGLKRLDAAERDGDRIYAVIRGIGSSSDGRGGAIYAPMPEGQVRALRRAYTAAGYGPDTVELVEAHGTATPAGDAAEFQALRQVFGESGRQDDRWCALGTVKSQIGHTKAAAGAAGLVKAVLALHHRVLPPTIKVTRPSSKLGIEDSPFHLNTTARPWTRASDHPRRASVSSFGFGGANFHVALEEHPSTPRSPMPLPKPPSAEPAADVGRIAFVFPGQGAQYVGMGADIAMAFPGAQDVWDAAADVPLGERGLHDVVFPPAPFSDDERIAQERRLTATAWAQPALAAHSLSLLALLASAGIEPDCVAGHSLGELVALHAAGAMTADTLLRLARRRGELMARIGGPPGAMLAVAADPARVTAAIERADSVWLANVNAPRQTVVSGAAAAIDVLHKRLTADGIAARRLDVSTAFHSPLMASVTGPLGAFLDGVPLAAPVVDVYANADAVCYERDPAAVRARLAAHATSPVRFHDQIEAMYADGVRTFIEVGAGAALTGLIGQILDGRTHLAVSLDRRGRNGVTSWHDALSRLAAWGVPITTSGRRTPAPPRPTGDRPRMTVRIDGTGYRPPRADPPVHTAPPAVPLVHTWEPAAMPDFREPPPAEPSPQWLTAMQELHRQTAEAHMHFQDVLADAHRAYLRMAESTFAALAAPGAYVPAAQQPLPPTSLPSTSLPSTSLPSTSLAPAPLPPAPAIPTPVTLAPPEAFQPAGPPPVVVPPTRPEPEPAAALDLGLLLDVVADKTGYPVDMLGGTMDLEADLGIDSIKKVEIFSAVRQRVAGMPPADSPQMAQLFQLRTLDQIVRWAGDGHDSVSRTSRDRSGNGDPGPPVPRRFHPCPIAAPACGLALAGLLDAPLVVVDGGSGLAAALVDQLASHHITAVAADTPEPDSWGVILLHGMADPGRAAHLHRAAFRAARTVAATMTERGGVFVTVQDTGGRFGLDPGRAGLAGLAALARTAALEWPLAAVKAIDCERAERADEAVAAAIAAELVTGGATIDVGLRADGSRWTVGLSEAPATTTEPVITADSVVVATGGARGVTAAALHALAVAHRPKMLLLGRTELVDEPPALAAAVDEPALTRLLAGQLSGRTPAQLTARARAILASREIRATLTAIERAGATVRYASVDVTDHAALDRELTRVRRDWGPVTALVHGAGVLADRRIVDKTDDQFDHVYDTKVAGWHALMAATAADPLRLLCVFSSVAARFGNPGQSDYAMANETLNHLAEAERHRRPDCRVISIGWGPWAGGMVTESLAAHFAGRGIPLIPLDAGAAAFLTEVDSVDAATNVLIAAGVDLPRPKLAADITISTSTHAHLADHAPARTPVLPLAVALEWFAAVSRSRHPDRDVDLRDIRVLRRVDLPDLATGHRLTIEGRPADRDEWDLSLGSSGATHYRARSVTPDAHRTRTWTGLADTMTIDDAYDSPALFHGPRFQALQTIDGLSTKGADARVIGVRDLGWTDSPWWTDPAAVDGALQAAVLWVSRTAGDATLPMGVDRFRVRRVGPASAPLRCLVRAGTVAAGHTRCDIALLDPDGEPRVELLGVSLIRRPDLVLAETAARE